MNIPSHPGWRRCRARRGFGCRALVVTVAIIALVCGAITVALVSSPNATDDEAEIWSTRVKAWNIRMGVKAWWMDHDNSTCPEVKTLIQDGALENVEAAKHDGWGEPWRIVCAKDDVMVRSNGPDEKPDTEDDIYEPSR